MRKKCSFYAQIGSPEKKTGNTPVFFCCLQKTLTIAVAKKSFGCDLADVFRLLKNGAIIFSA